MVAAVEAFRAEFFLRVARDRKNIGFIPARRLLIKLYRKCQADIALQYFPKAKKILFPGSQE